MTKILRQKERFQSIQKGYLSEIAFQNIRSGILRVSWNNPQKNDDRGHFRGYFERRLSHHRDSRILLWVAMEIEKMENCKLQIVTYK